MSQGRSVEQPHSAICCAAGSCVCCGFLGCICIRRVLEGHLGRRWLLAQICLDKSICFQGCLPAYIQKVSASRDVFLLMSKVRKKNFHSLRGTCDCFCYQGVPQGCVGCLGQERACSCPCCVRQQHTVVSVLPALLKVILC